MTRETREATATDLDSVVEMAQSIALQSEFQRGVSIDPDHVRRAAASLIASSDCAILLALKSGDPVGMLGLAFYPHLLSGSAMAAQLFWWVLPEHRDGIGRELLVRAEQIAKARGAHGLQMLAPTPAFAAVFQRSGYSKTSDVFEKGL